jgi:predicted TIM-barrel fold metal-dependent hydrolase
MPEEKELRRLLIDFHTHAFPERIAPMAMERLSHQGGGQKPETNGTLASLKEEMAKDGVDISVLLTIATNPKQQHKVNDFAIASNGESAIVAFGSVHPDAPDALEELERIHAAGLKGVKLHPEYQGFYADDPRMKPIYRKISDLGLIALFHAGVDYAYAPPYHAMPDQLVGALKMLDTHVVAAHWGGVDCGVEVLEKLCGKELYLDLSYGYGAMPKPIAQAIADKHGTDRLLFASDMPWHRPSWEIRLIESLDLSSDDKEKIYHRNAEKLLNL